MIVTIMFVALSDVTASCLSNGHTCKADGSMGSCCSGFCYQQRRWKTGYCKDRLKPYENFVNYDNKQ